MRMEFIDLFMATGCICVVCIYVIWLGCQILQKNKATKQSCGKKYRVDNIFGIEKKVLKQEWEKFNELFKKILPILLVCIFVFCIYADQKQQEDMFYFRKILGISLVLSALGYSIMYWVIFLISAFVKNLIKTGRSKDEE